MKSDILEYNIRGYDRRTGKELSVPYSTFWDYRDAIEYVIKLTEEHPDVLFELIVKFK